MEHEPEVETKIISDNRLTTYLSFREFNLATIKENGNVKFEVSGVGLSDAIKDFYNNPEVRLFDYFRHFDLVRDMVRGAK